ncbi:MAG: hypothetical protein ABSG10_01130 [Terracidiphilus sp.]|jgi:hypothetical protein
MQWEIFQHEDKSGDWVVEGINFSGDGEIYTTIFSGASAESRARQYLAWANAPELVAA